MSVAIVGGGIAGLATAIALRRRNIDATVHEQTPKLRPVGAAIGLAPNAMAVLARLGLAETVREAGVRIRRTVFLTGEGRTLMETDLAALGSGVADPIVMIRRATLQDLLVGALADDVLDLGRTCTGLDRHDDGVTVRFEDGAREADLAVGADGIGSVVRREVDPDRTVRDIGHTTYRGIVSHALAPDRRSTGHEIWGRSGRVGFAPVAPDAVYWFADLDTACAPADGETTKRRLVDRFAGYPAPVPRLVDETPAAEIIHTPVTDLPPPDSLWRDRVVLVGDAAHAVTPDLAQGAAQALEDAVALADRLDGDGSPRAAFAAYETARLDRVRRIRRDSRRFRRVAHLDWGPAIRVRNALVRYTPRSIVERQLRRTFTPAI